MNLAEQLARQFHDTYERLAPAFGYSTRVATRKFDPHSANGRLMITVCQSVVVDEIERLRAERDRLAGSLSVCGVIAREGDGTCLPEYETDSVLAVRKLRAEVEALKEESALWEERARHCGWRDEHAAMAKEKP